MMSALIAQNALAPDLVQTGSDRDRARRWVGTASVEISARDSRALSALTASFPAGSEVAITFLSETDAPLIAKAAAGLVEAGYIPVPHLSARSFSSKAALEAFVAALSDAGVAHVLLIGGDPKPGDQVFADALAVLKAGILQKHSIWSVGLAGHPEGLKNVDDEILKAALREKISFARAAGLSPRIYTQFGFAAEPLIAYCNMLVDAGLNVPVRIGLAGPANPMTLMRYAALCGIGPSMAVLKTKFSRRGMLAMAAGPDEVIEGLACGFQDPHSQIEGIHLFTFGGIAQAGRWRQARLD